MNRSVKTLILFLITISWLSGLEAQEIVTPLFGKKAANEQHRERLRTFGSTGTELLELPFMDDFSQVSGIPDTALWIDDHAFINNNYCIEPVTFGVATLDALDFDASIYPDARRDPFTFVADYLTSRAIDLDYQPADSIYFSFLYQPGGLGEMPDPKDSLLVDFYDPGAELWKNVWGIPGDSVHPFRHAMIPVTEENFLDSGFRFRFRNRVSLSGNDDFPGKISNVDHWNVDYVRLDRNRSSADTILRDVAFIEQPTSMLKNLTSLPWTHFNQAKNTVFQSPVSVRYRNNDSITRNITRSMTVHDLVYNELVRVGNETAQDLPFMEDTIVDFDFFYPFNTDRGDSGVIRFKAALRTDEIDPKQNDTVVADQVFKDYYSYDDGSAEAGYGLRGQGSQNGMVAVKHNSYLPDLLGGVDIYFNHVLDSANLSYYFKLMVWDDDHGVPGSVLHDDTNDLIPEYTSSLNGFKRYYFSSPVPVDGPFHVGWLQYNKYFMNVGLDLNKGPIPQVRHYNLDGSWDPSRTPGILLIRPFLYNEITGAVKHSPDMGHLQIYPNPASDRVYFELPGKGSASEIQLEIFDVSGRQVHRAAILGHSHDISSVPAGFYFIRVRLGQQQYSAKLLIKR